MSYVLEGPEGGRANGDRWSLHDERPTQAVVKELGVGEYTLRRGSDFTVLKRWRVTVNKNRNLKVETITPSGLDAVSLHNLTTMRSRFEYIVKRWPEMQRNLNKLQAEIDSRELWREMAGMAAAEIETEKHFAQVSA